LGDDASGNSGFEKLVAITAVVSPTTTMAVTISPDRGTREHMTNPFG
jgi:hypothetical protein